MVFLNIIIFSVLGDSYLVCKRIAEIRKYEIGMSQAELSKAMGLNRPTLAAIEEGRTRVNIEFLIPFARLAKKSYSEILPTPFEKEPTTLERYHITKELVNRLRRDGNSREIEPILESIDIIMTRVFEQDETIHELHTKLTKALKTLKSERKRFP